MLERKTLMLGGKNRLLTAGVDEKAELPSAAPNHFTPKCEQALIKTFCNRDIPLRAMTGQPAETLL